jgi:hypothetical protein
MVSDLTGGAAGKLQAPTAFNFRRNRTSFQIEAEKLFDNPRNGLRFTVALDPGIAREAEFQLWLFEVGSSNGTRPEFAVYRELERRGLLAPTSRPEAGFDFEFQVPLLGGRSDGGAVVDMVVYTTSPNIAIRIQGEFFHFKNDEIEKGDIFQRIAIESAGFKVVDILAQDTLQRGRLEEVVGMALHGFEAEFTGRLEVFQ